MIIAGEQKHPHVVIHSLDSDNVGHRDELTGNGELKMVAQELIEAVSAKDSQAVEDCLRAAFEILESEPHTEGPVE